VQINIYNASGRLVRELVNMQQSEGEHTIVWDATNNRAQKVSDGFYFYELSVDGYSTVEKMILVK